MKNAPAWEHKDDEFELVLICRAVSGSSLLELELIVYFDDQFLCLSFLN